MNSLLTDILFEETDDDGKSHASRFFSAKVALRAVCSFLAACSLSKIQHIQDHRGSWSKRLRFAERDGTCGSRYM